ncbi:unnamed protein product [Aureobasidium mustum]|uniref:Uncharacterized protein n=1 Tax=Aureobasidium mustum TaxID=2773714 RepID=A0A9N8K460_9PEZI|nr:unnamed protein product [Aureobasidium mustum]
MLPLWTRLTPLIRQITRSWTTVRLFSYTRASFDEPKDGKDTPDDTLKAARPACRKSYYHRVTKKKLDEDPEYRAKRLEQRRKSNENHQKRIQADPDYRAKIAQQVREWQEKRYRGDREYTERRRRANREYMRLRNEDPEDCIRHREHMQIAQQERLLQDDAAYKKNRFVAWLRYTISKHNLEWTSHQPLLYSEKVVKHCISCNRFKPLKLWWKKKTASTEAVLANAEQFECMSCFFNHAGNNLMPTGYEGVTFQRPTAVKHSNI